ncbi:putative RNA methyltransferase [Nonomuraea typhae]|uniref:putative RNA methyltransferase n=1 Tax=Nonomuraea typhae TaxID=2603600 RepID=UPI0015E20CD2|nr:methyltransferase domain-containing protein [Nonomuraea typhae]
MLADVVPYLVCPVCRGSLELLPGTVRCASGHAFDVARQGYVSLLTGSRSPGTADTPQMVAARDAFLAAGHYAPLAAELAKLCSGAAVTVEAGAGTGYYLARALGPGGVGIAFDVSKHAVKRAARAHERIGAFVGDVWQPLPIASGVADVVLDVFAPRNGSEFARVLRAGGRLVVVTPAVRHLEPLVSGLGLLTVDADKQDRVARGLPEFTLVEQRELAYDLELGAEEIAAVVGMGPSAWHLEEDVLRARISGLLREKNLRKMSTHVAFQLSIFGVVTRSRSVP